MDLVLAFSDRFFFTRFVYPIGWPEDSWSRQLLSLLVITNVGGLLLYFATAGFSYFFIFDKKLLNHPQILKNQVSLEMEVAVKSIPLMSLPTVAIFFLEVQGCSKLYDGSSLQNCWVTFALDLIWSFVSFILFTDCMIYWIHRALHHRLVYKYIHKVHHRWKVPTPFASHAFHPVDGFLQSCPYHLFPFIFPLNKLVYLALFLVVNVWTVSIHDGDYRVPRFLRPIINGSAHHTDHHSFFDCNYGQFLTFWDRVGSSFRPPSAFEGKGPLFEVKKLAEKENWMFCCITEPSIVCITLSLDTIRFALVFIFTCVLWQLLKIGRDGKSF